MRQHDLIDRGIIFSMGSAEGVQDYLSIPGKDVAWLFAGELKEFFDAKSWQHKLADFLTGIYTEFKFDVPLSTRGKADKPRRSDYCALSVLGNIQPGIFEEFAPKAMEDSGFFGRCLFFVHPGEVLHHPNELANNDDLEMLYKLRCKLKAIAGVFTLAPESTNFIRAELDSYHAAGDCPARRRRYFNEQVPAIAFLLCINQDAELDMPGSVIPHGKVLDAMQLVDRIYTTSEGIIQSTRVSQAEREQIKLTERILKVIKSDKAGISLGTLANKLRGLDKNDIIRICNSLSTQQRVIISMNQKKQYHFKAIE
jgi:hypothetical protein